MGAVHAARGAVQVDHTVLADRQIRRRRLVPGVGANLLPAQRQLLEEGHLADRSQAGQLVERSPQVAAHLVDIARDYAHLRQRLARYPDAGAREPHGARKPLPVNQALKGAPHGSLPAAGRPPPRKAKRSAINNCDNDRPPGGAPCSVGRRHHARMVAAESVASCPARCPLNSVLLIQAYLAIRILKLVLPFDLF